MPLYHSPFMQYSWKCCFKTASKGWRFFLGWGEEGWLDCVYLYNNPGCAPGYISLNHLAPGSRQILKSKAKLVHLLPLAIYQCGKYFTIPFFSLITPFCNWNYNFPLKPIFFNLSLSTLNLLMWRSQGLYPTLSLQGKGRRETMGTRLFPAYVDFTC